MEKAVKQQETLVAIQSEMPIFMLYNTHKTHTLVHLIMVCYIGYRESAIHQVRNEQPCMHATHHSVQPRLQPMQRVSHTQQWPLSA